MKGKIIECQDCGSRWSLDDRGEWCPQCESFNFRLVEIVEKEEKEQKYLSLLPNRFLCVHRNDIKIAISSNLSVVAFSDIVKTFENGKFEIGDWTETQPPDHLILE